MMFTKVIFLAVLAFSGLSACAIIPQSERASTGTAPATGTFRLAPTDSPTADETMARREVVRLLQSRGMEESSNAEREVEVTLSRRPPTLGISASAALPEAQTAVPTSATIDARSRNNHILPVCKDAVIRLSIAMVDTSTGTILYRAQAEDRTCRKVSRKLVQELGMQALVGS